MVGTHKSGESMGRGLYSYAYVNDPNTEANAFINKTFTAVGVKGENGNMPQRYLASNPSVIG